MTRLTDICRHLPRRCTMLLVALGLSCAISLSQARAEQVTIFAAASLKNVVDAIAPQFEQETGEQVLTSYAGSSVLARQILLGAPADLFLSANEGWVDALAQKNLLASDALAFASNRLVLIAPRGSEPPAIDLTDNVTFLAALNDGRLAMALVEAVPAGIYGKAALTNLGVWDDLAPQVAQADNVRAALALVALGEAPLGLVYASDALAEPRVQIVAEIPSASHPEIQYVGGVIEGANSASALAFLQFLHGETGAKTLVHHGFIPLNAPR